MWKALIADSILPYLPGTDGTDARVAIRGELPDARIATPTASDRQAKAEYAQLQKHR